jgi:hypothetical protein
VVVLVLKLMFPHKAEQADQVVVVDEVAQVGQRQQAHLVKETQAVVVADQLLIMVAAVAVGRVQVRLVEPERRLPEEMAEPEFKVHPMLHRLEPQVLVDHLAQDIFLAVVVVGHLMAEQPEQVE